MPAPRVVGVRWSSPARGPARVGAVCEWECGGLGDAVSSRGAGSPGGHACALGLVRRPVALSGLLLRWPSGALGYCGVERGWVTETFLTMRTIRVARS